MKRRPHPSARATEDMIQRIVAADFGDGSPESREAVNQHLRDMPEHAAVHDSVMDLWDDLGRLETPVLSTQKPERRTSRLWLVAASILLPVLATGLMFFAQGAFSTRDVVQLRTGSDERRIVTLADGSTVSLSPDTVLKTDLQRGRRLLVLEQGEALFDVAHDPGRPFFVDVGSGQVQAVGTKFNIRKDEDIVVTVVEGVVRVTTGPVQTSGRMQLSQTATAGHQVHLGKRSLDGVTETTATYLSPARKVEAERYTSWVSGMLSFEGEPLSEVVKELNRYSSRKIRLTDLSVADMPIYGTLNIGDAEGLQALVQDLERGDGRRTEPLLAPTSR
ncbi:fec operon regulator FecR [compost metagenome]